MALDSAPPDHPVESTRRPQRGAARGPGVRTAPGGAHSAGSQRSRLVAAMVELSAEAGYQRVSIAELCSAAGVSPVSFYEQVADKEALLVAAYRACSEDLIATLRAAVAHADRERLPRVVLEAL